MAAICAATFAYQSSVAAPAAKGGGKAAATKKEEPPPKMEGQEVSRGESGFMGVEIKDGRFVIHFYDKEKKPMTPDVARIALRWDPKYKLGMERVVLGPGPENTMTSERFIRPPYNFKLFIVLVKGGADEADAAGETYTIDFRQ